MLLSYSMDYGKYIYRKKSLISNVSNKRIGLKDSKKIFLVISKFANNWIPIC